MRDVYLERTFAVGLFLLLWLYYRWLEWGDSKRRQKHLERKRREEHVGSVPLPKELQWKKGASSECPPLLEHYLVSHFSTSNREHTSEVGR